MSSFTLSRVATSDMKSIGTYTQKHWGATQRKIYLQSLDESFHVIADNPRIGLECSYLVDGLRKYNYKHHVIFYKAKENGVFIIRILHKSMDVSLHRFES